MKLYKIETWLLITVVFATLEFPNVETTFFGADPGSCETRADVVESDYFTALVIGGRTMSRNLFTNTGETACLTSFVPYLAKLKPTGTLPWLNYYSSNYYTAEFTAIRFAPDVVYTNDYTYQHTVTAFLKSKSVT